MRPGAAPRNISAGPKQEVPRRGHIGGPAAKEDDGHSIGALARYIVLSCLALSLPPPSSPSLCLSLCLSLSLSLSLSVSRLRGGLSIIPLVLGFKSLEFEGVLGRGTSFPGNSWFLSASGEFGLFVAIVCCQCLVS